MEKMKDLIIKIRVITLNFLAIATIRPIFTLKDKKLFSLSLNFNVDLKIQNIFIINLFLFPLTLIILILLDRQLPLSLNRDIVYYTL